jgi:hypothetical protein
MFVCVCGLMHDVRLAHDVRKCLDVRKQTHALYACVYTGMVYYAKRLPESVYAREFIVCECIWGC